MPIINLDDARIAYLEGGSGEPVMALHSSAGSGAQWKALQQDTKDSFHVLAPDLCGYGASDNWSGKGALTLAAEGQRMTAIMDRLVEPVHLIGHSYGGAVALRIALDKPHRVRSLTLIEPVAFHLLRHGGAHERELFSEVSGVAGAIADAVNSGNHEKGMSRFIDYWGGAGTWNRIQPDKQVALKKQTNKVALDFWATCTEPAKLEEYRQIRLPTLIMRGEHSPAPTQRIAELLTATLPFARLETIDGAGHMGPITHATPFNELIGRHLQTHMGRYRRAA